VSVDIRPALPYFGIISGILPVFSRKPLLPAGAD
jgi:hypothetical protein